MDKQLELIQQYQAAGYDKVAEFPGEYVLMIKPDTLDKLRVYEHGNVWIADSRTGEYKKGST